MPDDLSGALPVRPTSPPRRVISDLLARRPDLETVALGSAAASGAPDVAGVAVTGCTHDSRAVRPGDLYAALPGARVHGADFADQVLAAGAVAVLTDRSGAERFVGRDVVVLVADDPRGVLGDVAAWVHGDPAEDLLVIGVTGTNGKTTTAFLLEAGLRAAGHVTGLLGTVETRIADEVVPSVRTTPEAPDLQGLLAVMRERGVTAVAMEVSSHALALGRVDGVRFDTAVFTNLSQDHLDFHETMADYEAAKADLFTPRRCRRAVVNVDDPAGARIAEAAAALGVPVARLGAEGEWHAVEVELRPDGADFRFQGPTVDLPASVALAGGFNVVNAMGALVALDVSGVDVEEAAVGISALTGVPGRMEPVDAGQRFLAVVDYAHTPEAVTTLLRAVRAVTTGRVIVVLGCGGDRDRAKRPLMGRAAVEGADVAVLTSDNPRSEDPLLVLHDMTVDLGSDREGVVVEPDRRRAIELALSQALPGDTVVVAGKGHETGQEVQGVITPFDDRTVLRELLSGAPG